MKERSYSSDECTDDQLFVFLDCGFATALSLLPPSPSHHLHLCAQDRVCMCAIGFFSKFDCSRSLCLHRLDTSSTFSFRSSFVEILKDSVGKSRAMNARRVVSCSRRMMLVRSTMRRERSSGSVNVFDQEEKAAENIYIKKMEQEKLEKLVRQGVSLDEAKATASGSPTASPRAAKTSTDTNTNYAPVVGGIVGAVALAYWYSKKFLFINDAKTVDALNRQSE